MTDFSLKSKALLIRQLNARFDAFFKLDDIDFINLTALATGEYNTQITAYATSGGDYRDSAVFKYNRVNLNRVITEPVVFMSAAGISTTADIITRLNTLYGTAFENTDIVVEDVTITALTTTLGIFTLKAISTSLMYIGSVDIYFGDEAVVRKWVRNSDIQYQSDGKSFSISGKSRLQDTAFIIGKKGTFTPASSDTGLVLGSTGVQTLSSQAIAGSSTVARFRAGKLLELPGPAFETSYDTNNNCLNIVPRLPAPLSAFKEIFPYTGSLSSGLMTFSTTFDLSQWAYPFGVTYYVDSVNGADNATGTSSAPLKSFGMALDKSPAANTIIIKAGSSAFVSRTLTDRNLIVIGENATTSKLVGELTVPSWTLYSDSNTTYQYLYTGAGVAGVFDYSVLDSNGLPKRLTLVDGPASVVSTPGSYHLSSTALLIQTSNGRKPDSDIRIVLTGSGLTINGTSLVHLANLSVENTDVGIVAESVTLAAKPTLTALNVNVKGTFTNGCLNNYGATTYLQNCTFKDGKAYGSYYGYDRQTIQLGVPATFLEVGCVVDSIYAAGSGSCRGSLATAGVTGIRFKSTYRNVSGYPIEEYGAGTYIAHFETIALNNALTNIQTGALYAAGKDTVGSNVYGRSVTYLYSCTSDNGAKVGLMTYGTGEIHLYNTPVGTVAQYNKPNPYKFIYTSDQLADFETV